MKSLMKIIMQKPITHRGLHDYNNGIIENSPSAFEAAINSGYAIECDLQFTKDEKAIIFHDATLERLTNKQGKTSDISLKQATNMTLKNSANNDKILSLAQMLKQVNGRATIVLELKMQTDGRNDLFAKAVVHDLKNYQGSVAIISFVPEILLSVKKYGFKGPVGVIVERFIHEKAQQLLTQKQRFYLRHLLHYPKTKFDFVDADHNALDLPAVKLFRALGFPIMTWTIKSQVEADEALKWCDQITFEGFIPKQTSEDNNEPI